MREILFYDYAALAILFTVLLSIYTRKIKNGSVNILFVGMTVLSIITILCDIIFNWLVSPVYVGETLSETSVILAYVFAYAYFFLRNTTGFLFLLFTFSLTRTMFKIRKIRTRVLLGSSYVLFILVLISNFFTGAIFTISAENGYIREPLISLVYLMTILFLVIGFINLIINQSLFTIEKWIALLIMYIITFSAVAYQFFHPGYLVELFSASISLLLMILVVIRPEEITDSVSGELSFKAYQSELFKLSNTKQPVQIAAINIKNAIEVRNFLGEELFSGYVKEFIASIKKLCKEEELSFQIYADMPDNVYIIIDNMDFRIDEKMLALLDFREFEASAMRLLPRLCSIKFLVDTNSVDDVVYISRNFGDMIGNLQRYAKASDLISTREYKIRRDIDNILTRAIKNKKFELYYQPIYSLKEKCFVSAEALIRLNDSEYGFIPPSIFIPLSESRGLIHQIGDIVLEEVYLLVSKYNLKELGIKYMDVNLSVAQCMRRDLVDKICHLEETYAVSRNSIKMEITETYLGESMDDIIHTLTDMGYDFALDDYGTGYSNIHRILELPLRIIKIDKSLVEGMKTSNGYTILKSTIDMLHNVNFKIIVEGVEDEEQFSKLEDMGADYIQGYYFSKPLPEKEFIHFIEENRKKKVEVV